MRWLDSIMDSMDMSLSKLWEIVKDWKAWRTAFRGVAKSWTAKDGVRGPVLLPLTVTPLDSLGSQPPCLLLPLPLLVPGLRRLTGQRAARQGDPALHHQDPLLLPATPSHRLTQRAQTGTPAARVGRPHSLQAAIGKLSLALTLDPQLLQGAAASGTGPEAARCLSPGGLSPGEQPGAEVRVLQWAGLLLRGHRPHLASLDPRGPGAWGGGNGGPHAGERRGRRRR